MQKEESAVSELTIHRITEKTDEIHAKRRAARISFRVFRRFLCFGAFRGGSGKEGNNGNKTEEIILYRRIPVIVCIYRKRYLLKCGRISCNNRKRIETDAGCLLSANPDLSQEPKEQNHPYLLQASALFLTGDVCRERSSVLIRRRKYDNDF